MLPTPVIKSLDENVYEPAEDSFLLLDSFEEDRDLLNKRFANTVPLVVEIGAGSGIVTTFIKQNILTNGIYITTDLNPHACRQVVQTVIENEASKKDPFNLDSCQMDLTSSIRHESVDVLVFNPPYVPAEEVPVIPDTEDDETWLDLALCGGPKGMDVTWKVLYGLEAILSDNGIAYILFCARNEPDKVQAEMVERGWKVDKIIERKAGWEILSVLRIQRIVISKEI